MVSMFSAMGLEDGYFWLLKLGKVITINNRYGCTSYSEGYN